MAGTTGSCTKIQRRGSSAGPEERSRACGGQRPATMMPGLVWRGPVARRLRLEGRGFAALAALLLLLLLQQDGASCTSVDGGGEGPSSGLNLSQNRPPGVTAGSGARGPPWVARTDVVPSLRRTPAGTCDKKALPSIKSGYLQLEQNVEVYSYTPHTPSSCTFE